MQKILKSKKTVLLHVTSSLKVGGAERVLCDLIRFLQNDFEQHVAYLHSGTMYDEILGYNASLHSISGLISKYDPFLISSLIRVIKDVKPDLIHSSLWVANLSSSIASKILKIPTIVSLHNNLEQDGKFRNCLSKICLPFSSKVVAVSDEVAIGYKNRFYRDAEIIKNGIDLDLLKKNVLNFSVSRSDLGLDDSHFVIGSVGRFEPVKNYKLLILSSLQLMKKFENVRLLLVGFGSQEIELKNFAKSLGISNSVIFIVGQSGYKYLKTFDCFALSSSKEGISIALLEAMGLAIAPVVTNFNKSHDVINDGYNGFIAAAGDKNSLAACIEKIIKSFNLRMYIAKNAEKTVFENFSIKLMVEKYKKLYNKIYKC